MNLNEVLTKIADYAHLDADALIAYAAEDTQGGRGQGYDNWSIDADEGKVLYALVRALKPSNILEIGVREGASTAHLLAAIERNVIGHLDSFDLESNETTRDFWTFHQGDALETDYPDAEFVFEDSAHDLNTCLVLFERFKPTVRILVTHDYAMTTEHGDFHVKEAFDQVFPDGIAFTMDGCERGLAIWVNSAQERPPVDIEPTAVKQVVPPKLPAKKTVAKKASTPAKKATRQ